MTHTIRIFTFLCFSLACLSPAFGQLDTLLFEDFDFGLPTFDSIPEGTNTNWVNWDQDTIEPGNLSVTSSYWFERVDFTTPPNTPVNLANKVIASCSWLHNFSPESSNWLILPPITIEKTGTELHWKSAPYQGPKYMDGYKVKISTTGNLEADFSTLFEAAEMTEIIGIGDSTNLDDYEFSAGYIHADGYTLTDYFIPSGTTNALNGAHLGVLEPHTLNLDAYVGQTVYIAFHHDSSNDNILALDDIAVVQPADPLTTSKLDRLPLRIFPNPAQERIWCQSQSGDLEAWTIQNAAGMIFSSQEVAPGSEQVSVPINGLAPGIYYLRIRTSSGIQYASFVKN